MNILMTVEELAKYLKIKPDTIYKKVRKGELPAIKLGKLVRFPKDLIDQWIVEQATKTMKEVRVARKNFEAKTRVAVGEARKAAKVASKVMGDVPDVLDELKKAPLNKKQEVLTKGLRTLWKDFNAGVHAKGKKKAKATGGKKRQTARQHGKTTKAGKAKAGSSDEAAGASLGNVVSLVPEPQSATN